MIETAYPIEFEADVVLRTGRTLHVRPVRADDRDRLLKFYSHLSPESLHARFFEFCSPEHAVEATPSSVDYDRVFGVVGESGDDIVAVAHYFSSAANPRAAEVAFAIDDAFQRAGIGTKLLELLVAAARTHDIERFEAEVLSENRAMLDVFLGVGFQVQTTGDRGVTHLAFPIAPTATSVTLASDRSRQAATASLRAVMAPRSIAVIGASRRPGQLGHEIVRHLSDTGFRGALYAVHPHVDSIDGVRAYRRVTDIPDDIDLAIIAVPAMLVETIVDDCIAKHVNALAVISAGFSETGEKGAALERRLLDKVRSAGIRMVGPNCMGVINTDPNVRMHATFSPLFPTSGNVAMSSQSGALGLAVLDYAAQLRIGFSSFISVGNKADVSGNDLIQYWAGDPRTDVILLYLESFGNPRKFAEIARRVGREKPILAVKAGRSAGGSRAASSHTGALAASDTVVDELFRQSGVIRTDTLEEMFDAGALLANQPLPAGNRVAIVTNAGGPGILAADACEASGLALASFSVTTAAKLRDILPPSASMANPIDMIASAGAEQYRRTLEAVLEDPGVDCVIAIYIPVLSSDASQVAAAIGEASRRGKTILTTFMSASGAPPELGRVPAFPFPERAVHALAIAARYAKWRSAPASAVVHFADIFPGCIRPLIHRALQRGGGWLDPIEVRELLRAIAVPAPDLTLVSNSNDAMEAATSLGFPVALKAYGPDLIHKSDVAGVKLQLRDEWSVCVAFEALKNSLGDRMTAALVQKMALGGVEMMVGATRDAMFGHLVAAGAGGTLIEVFKDVSFRLHPVTDFDAEAMVSSLRSARMLRGYRGSAPVDIEAFRSTILRVSALLEICPEIAELDINPLIVHENGVSAVDARIRVEAVAPPPASRRVTY